MKSNRVPPSIIVGILSLSGVVAALNQTLVIPLIPAFPEILDVSSDDASWFITITIVVGAVSIPTISRLADMYGKRRMLLLCLLLMAIGAAISGAGSHYVPVLIGRGLAGFGLPLIPIGISILRDSLPPHRIGTAVALMSATLGIGTALGLPLSGVLYQTVGWRWAFWLTLIVAGVLAAAVMVWVPTTHHGHGGRFDVPGAVMLSGAVAAIVVTISKGGVWGWGSPLTLGTFGSALVLLAFWVLFELRTRDPIVDLRSSGSRPVALTNIAAVLIGFALFINLLLAMQQLQAPEATGYGFGLSVLDASILMIPSGVAMVALSPLNGYLLRVWSGKYVLILGATIMSAGYVLRIFLSNTAFQVLVSTTIVNIGTAFAYAAMPTIIMTAVAVDKTAAANGLNTLVRQIGMSASSSSVAAVLATGTLSIAGAIYPTWQAMTQLNLLAAGACVIGAAISCWVPAAAAAPEVL